MTDPITFNLQLLAQMSANHVRKNGMPSVAPPGEDGVLSACRYDGIGCGAAPFILKYDPRMEMKNFEFLVTEGAGSGEQHSFHRELYRFEPLAVQHARFVGKVLQAAHDLAAKEAHDAKEPFMPIYERHLAERISSWNKHNGTEVKVPA